MKITIYLLAVVFLASCTYAQAETTLQWDRPVERENGEQLFIYEIDHFELSTACDDGAEQLIEIVGDVEEITVNYIGECVFKILAVDTNGLYSVWSESVTITIKSPPKAPFNLRIFGG